MAAPQKKVIVTCAITGGIHTPSMSPHLPVTPKQIEDEAVAAAEAGASIVHLHARVGEKGALKLYGSGQKAGFDFNRV